MLEVDICLNSEDAHIWAQVLTPLKIPASTNVHPETARDGSNT